MTAQPAAACLEPMRDPSGFCNLHFLHGAGYFPCIISRIEQERA
jgi:hypothetical protein